MCKKPECTIRVSSLTLRLPKNAIPPEQVLRVYRSKRRDVKGRQELPPLLSYLCCLVNCPIKGIL